MTPIINYDTPGYQKTKEMLQHQYPSAKFFWPDGLFSGRYDWLRRFPSYLQASDCGLIIPDWQGMVGYGVFAEFKAFVNAAKPVYCLADTRIIRNFALLVENESDWKRYARVVVKASTQKRSARKDVS